MMLRGYVGSGAFEIGLYTDADFAGCKETARSTSGLWVVLRGKGWEFPLEWGSKRQSCVSHSTPEAELISLAKGLREAGLPLSTLLEAMFQKESVLVVAEQDNSATIQIVKKGRSPALRHLAETHRVSLAWVSEVCSREGIRLQHCPTLLQLADGFTKVLDRLKFLNCLLQLNIF